MLISPLRAATRRATDRLDRDHDNPRRDHVEGFGCGSGEVEDATTDVGAPVGDGHDHLVTGIDPRHRDNSAKREVWRGRGFRVGIELTTVSHPLALEPRAVPGRDPGPDVCHPGYSGGCPRYSHDDEHRGENNDYPDDNVAPLHAQPPGR